MRQGNKKNGCNERILKCSVLPRRGYGASSPYMRYRTVARTAHAHPGCQRQALHVWMNGSDFPGGVICVSRTKETATRLVYTRSAGSFRDSSESFMLIYTRAHKRWPEQQPRHLIGACNDSLAFSAVQRVFSPKQNNIAQQVDTRGSHCKYQ